MTEEEIKELEALREFKIRHDRSSLIRAFERLEVIYHAPYSQRADGIMSVKAFRAVAECVMLLKQELFK